MGMDTDTSSLQKMSNLNFFTLNNRRNNLVSVKLNKEQKDLLSKSNYSFNVISGGSRKKKKKKKKKNKKNKKKKIKIGGSSSSGSFTVVITTELDAQGLLGQLKTLGTPFDSLTIGELSLVPEGQKE